MASHIATIKSVQVPNHLAVALERVIWGTYGLRLSNDPS